MTGDNSTQDEAEGHAVEVELSAQSGLLILCVLLIR